MIGYTVDHKQIIDIFNTSHDITNRERHDRISAVLTDIDNDTIHMIYRFFSKYYNINRVDSYYITDDTSIASDMSFMYEKLNEFKPYTNNTFVSTVKDIIDIIQDTEKQLLDNYLNDIDISTNYIISMDKIPITFHNDIINNKSQTQEWESLGLDIDNVQSLYIDTVHFDNKQDIIDNVQCDITGICIKSDNLKALHYLQNSTVDFIYIDPPYNTNILDSYKNQYTDNNYKSLIYSRLLMTRKLMNNTGTICCAIDDLEFSTLQNIMDDIFGIDKRLGNLVIVNKPSGRTIDKYLATCHEYCMIYGYNNKINFFKLTESDIAKYVHSDDIGKYKWRDFLRTGGQSTPDECINQYYPIYYEPMSGTIQLEKFDNSIEILPIDSKGNKRVWRKTKKSFLEHLEKKEINMKWINNKWKVQLIDRIKYGTRPKSVWVDAKYDSAVHGTKLLKSMGILGFSFPKSLYAVYDVLYINNLHNSNAVILDFFAGSGTTAHGTILLNKQDNGNRKFILVEKGDQFDNIIIPRIKKLSYSMNWQDGKPLDYTSTSMFVQVLRF